MDDSDILITHRDWEERLVAAINKLAWDEVIGYDLTHAIYMKNSNELTEHLYVDEILDFDDIDNESIIGRVNNITLTRFVNNIINESLVNDKQSFKFVYSGLKHDEPMKVFQIQATADHIGSIFEEYTGSNLRLRVKGKFTCHITPFIN